MLASIQGVLCDFPASSFVSHFELLCWPCENRPDSYFFQLKKILLWHVAGPLFSDTQTNSSSG
jgi:hypothetical protein